MIGAGVGFWAGRLRSDKSELRRVEGAKSFAEVSEAKRQEITNESKQALDERTEERKSKILEFMRREGSFDQALQTCGIEQGENRSGVTRAEIEKFLGVSSKTALKYLNELESEAKIAQIGVKGPDVCYVLKSASQTP